MNALCDNCGQQEYVCIGRDMNDVVTKCCEACCMIVHHDNCRNERLQPKNQLDLKTLVELLTNRIELVEQSLNNQEHHHTGRLEIVIQDAAESICDAIESFANRMCAAYEQELEND